MDALRNPLLKELYTSGGEKMKKKLLALLMATTMSMALVACGGSEEAATEEVAVEEAVEEEAASEEVAEEEASEETVEMSEEEAAMRAVFTGAIAGSDEAENTYWFLFDDELTFGAFVILTADYTQSVNVVGEITSREEDGALVITDESTNSYIAFTVVEEGEDYLTVQIEDGNQVTMINYDLDEAIETVIGIDETTEIIG